MENPQVLAISRHSGIFTTKMWFFQKAEFLVCCCSFTPFTESVLMNPVAFAKEMTCFSSVSGDVVFAWVLNAKQWRLLNTHCAPNTTTVSCKPVGKKVLTLSMPSRNSPPNGEMGWKTNIEENNLKRAKNQMPVTSSAPALADCPWWEPPRSWAWAGGKGTGWRAIS